MASLVRRAGSLRRQLSERFFTFSDSVDYFNLFNIFGVLFALHYDGTGPKKLLWSAYRALYVLSYLSYCYKVGWTFSHWEYSTASANVLGAIGLCSGAFLRLLLIEHHYPALRKLQRFLNDRAYRAHDRWSRARRAKLYRQNNRFLVILISAIVLESLCFLARLLLTRPEFMLQYNGQVWGGPIVQLAYGTVTACWGIVYVLSFITFYMLIAGFRLEMEILVRSFQELDQALLRNHGVVIRTASWMGDSEKERAFWSDLRSELTLRIVRHVELLENLRQLRSIVAPFAFVQYYSTFGLIADSFFIVSFEGCSGYSVTYVLFASFLILESFLLSRGVEHLNELNHQIGMALYHLDWSRLLRYSARFRREYDGIRRTVLLTLVQTQRSLKFSYGAQGEISMNSFAELMQKSYSMLTFMLQLGN